jgi:hypothetical protein
MILNKNAAGLALGIVCALCMFLLALSAAYLGWGAGAIMIAQDVYIGYGASLLGGVIGAIWGFAKGYILGFLIACLYNTLSAKSSKPQAPQV